jgi:hypothetical protein
VGLLTTSYSSIYANNFIVGVSIFSPEDIHPNVSNYELCGQYRGRPLVATVNNVDCRTDIGPGRYVIIQLPATQFMAFTEVQVYGQRAVLKDLALHKPAFQSSIYYNKKASCGPQNGVNGDMHTNCMIHVCVYTKREVSPWWAVDLGYTYRIIRVNLLTTSYTPIYNLATDFIVGVTNLSPEHTHPNVSNYEWCGQHRGFMDASKWYGVQCRTDVQPGRYVIIQRPATGSLAFTEVQVYGQAMQ